MNDTENDEHFDGIVMIERKRKTVLPVTLTKNHASDFVEHQSLIMRLDLASNQTQQHDAIYWTHLSYINISMRKILVEFCRRSSLPQKFEDCIVIIDRSKIRHSKKNCSFFLSGLSSV